MISAAVLSFLRTTPHSGRYFNRQSIDRKTKSPFSPFLCRQHTLLISNRLKRGIFLGFYDCCRRNCGRYVRRYGLWNRRHLDSLVFPPVYGSRQQRISHPICCRKKRAVSRPAARYHPMDWFQRFGLHWTDAAFRRAHFPMDWQNNQPDLGTCACRRRRFSRPHPRGQRSLACIVHSRVHCACHSGFY